MTKRVDQEYDIELFRVRSSQPPGRQGLCPVDSCLAELDEVKSVCSESDPEPRDGLEFVGADPLRKGAGNTGASVTDELATRPSGVTDSIESNRGHVNNQAEGKALGELNDPEYPKATSTGSPGDGPASGMGDGLALKRGNSRGVKAPTHQQPWQGNHRRYPVERTNQRWQLT